MEYKDKVFKDLYDMPVGDVRDLDTSAPGYSRYVETVKEFITMQADIADGFELEFNADYSRLRKRYYASTRGEQVLYAALSRELR